MKHAILDHEIRWNFTYLKVFFYIFSFICFRMIMRVTNVFLKFNRLLQLRDFVNEIGAYHELLKVSPERWEIIEIITSILYEPYKLTMDLQLANFTLSDLFGRWIHMKRNLMKISHQFAKCV